MLQDLLTAAFDPAGLTPHGFCLLWEPWLIWSHALADLAIGLAYFSIPIVLIGFLRQRRDLVFRPVFWLFAAFILLCGTGHLIDLLTLWVPAYGLQAVVKIATAVVSVATAALLWPLLPRALALPSPAQLQAANAALAESEARHRENFLRSPMPLHTMDPDQTISGVSDRWLDLLGYTRDEVMGRPITDFMEPDSADRTREATARVLAGGELRDAERRFVRRDGAVLDVLVSGRAERAAGQDAPRILGALVDVTDRRRAEAALRASEERLRQTQKMEALGQLAGGIAHDFNNVLQAVGGGAALIERRAADPAAVRRLARMVGEASTRGATTTRRLLAFARRGQLQATAVDPALLLAELAEMLRHTLGPTIAVRVAAAATLPALLADRAELETVLINLATNARDAMPQGGTLTLGATAVGPSDGLAAEVAAGRYLRLTVHDTGLGMDTATLARATEPFFTTKAPEKGTGLGLATARGFAQQSNGALLLTSQPGYGTTAALWLPQAEDEAAGHRPGSRAAAAALAATGPRVLLVDDEPLVREVVAAELEERGYRVLPVASAAAALALLDAGRPVDLLITDFAMPEMDGLRLIRAAAERSPGLRAVLLTGHTEGAAELALDGAISGSFTLLRKPVSGAELAERAAALLTPGDVG